jgi:hypothetical protein
MLGNRMTVNPIVLLLPLLALAFWLFAESECGRAIRITSGIITILLVATSAWILAHLVPAYESDTHRYSLKLAEDLLAAGQTTRVQQAIQVYNAEAQTSTTFRAAMEMEKVLRNGKGVSP